MESITKKTRGARLEYIANLPASTPDISDEAAKLLGYFCVKAENDDNFTKWGWLSISRDDLYSLLGKTYAASVRELEEKRVLIHFEKEGVAYSGLQKLCKKYKLAKPYEDERERGDFKEIRLSVIKYVPPRKNAAKFKGKTSVTCSVQSQLIASYNGLEVAETWQDGEQRANYPIKRIYADQMATKTITATISESSGRCFHPFICSPREFREHFKYNGQNLVKIDAVTACVQFLAAKASPEDAETLKKAIDADFYSLFTGKGLSRDDIKKDFQRALSPRHRQTAATIAIRDWFATNTPSIAAWIKEKKELKNQVELQAVEASIFVYTFEHADFWCIPTHDGLAVLPEDVERAKEAIQARAKEILGFELKLETEQ